MKKIIFFVISVLVLLTSCDKLFVYVSGREVDLQGKWKMENVDTVFYNFQNNIFQYQIYVQKDVIKSVDGFYTLYGDTAIDLRLLQEYSPIHLDFLGWDTLRSYIYKDTIFSRFTIEKLTKKQLVLHSNKGRESFYKF